MKRAAGRRATFPVTAAAVVLTLAAGLTGAQAAVSAVSAPQATPKWVQAAGWGPNDGSSSVLSVASTSSTDTFAVGPICGSPCPDHALAIRHWTGKKWVTINPPHGLTSASVTLGGAVVAASSAANAWVFALLDRSSGPRTDALHWNGNQWGVTKLPAFSRIVTSAAFGSKNAWAFGTVGASAKPYNIRYTGKKWTTVHPPGDPQALSAMSASDMWAVGPTTKTATKPQGKQSLIAMQWNGTKWRTLSLPKVSLPPGDYVTAGTITALGAKNVWETYGLANAGTCCFFGGLEHWNGSKWHAVTVPYPAAAITSTASDGHGGLWMTVRTGDTPAYAFYHLNNGQWSRQFPPAFVNFSIAPAALSWVPGTRSLWSGGFGVFAGEGTLGTILGYGKH